jgi:ATP-dependent DNA helicase RecQ
MTKSQVLRETFGFDSFRPGQEAIVDSLLGGQHVLAVMPTGSGKSLCYQVPALVKGGLSLVVSPLVALMQDQVAALKLAGVAAETINSSAQREVNVEIWRRVAAGQVRLLYLAPERLMTARMIAALQELDVRLIAVDEAHCISQWGASFRPEYEALLGLRQAFPGAVIGAFTATADEAARKDIVAKLFGGKADVFVSGFDRPNISLAVTGKDKPRQQLLEVMERHRGASGIVYALSRKSTEEIAAFLRDKGFRAAAYHAGLTPDQRSETQDLFMSENGVIVVATIAFGMGIDKPDVRYVFHFDLPSSLDAYYQEIGRAGRDGAPAEAYMVFGAGDIVQRRRFIDEDGDKDETQRRLEHRRLGALISYCETSQCRREVLLAYFGETSGPCGNCDTCLVPGEQVDGTAEAMKILEAVRATGERFGAVHIATVLAGTSTAKVKAQRHEHLLAFGLGRDRPQGDWQSLIRQMVSAGLLHSDVVTHGGLSITPAGRALSRGEGGFTYRPDIIRPQSKVARTTGDEAVVAVPDRRQQALLGRLKQLRRELAAERKVPAFVIFSDRSLADMASRVPLTKWDFAEVHGVGDAKLAQFGTVFLTVITAFVAETAGQGPS